MHNDSWLEHFHNNIGEMKKTTYKHNQYFQKQQQYIQHERWTTEIRANNANEAL